MMKHRSKFWEIDGAVSCLNACVRIPVALLLAVVLASCRILPGAEELEQELAASGNVAGESYFDLESVRAKDPQSGIGAKEHPTILAANGGAYESQKLETTLALIATALVSASEDTERAFDITVLNSPSVNAFALPGGYLYVTRGLLALANDASEVAAVLAHEMAHVSSNHGLRRRDEARAVDMAKQVVSDVVSNPVVGEVAKASTAQKLAAFSQRQELQADAVGIKLVGKAGYDPFGAPRFLQSMQRYSAWRSALSRPESAMSSSHPSTPRRVELARRHARAVAPEGTMKRDRERFLQGVDGMAFGESAKEGFVRNNTFSHAGLGIRFSVPDSFELDNRSDAVLAAGPQQQALRFDAVDFGANPLSASDYLKSGWVGGLDEASVRRKTIGGRDAATGTAAAGAWRFHITVINHGKRHYRFILAAPRAETDIAANGERIVETFQVLSKAQIAALKPLRLRVVKAGAGDSVATLARWMKGVKRPEQLLRALNGLSAEARIEPGMLVKIVN